MYAIAFLTLTVDTFASRNKSFYLRFGLILKYFLYAKFMKFCLIIIYTRAHVCMCV